jgi:hypothetical protein
MPRQQCIAVRLFISLHLIKKGRIFGIKPLWGSRRACMFLRSFALFELRDMLASIIWVMLLHHLANHFFQGNHFV